MKTLSLILALLCGTVSLVQAAAENGMLQIDRAQRANVGVRAGFNSSMFIIDRFTVGGNDIMNIQNNYKVGYFGAFFCRINLKKHHFLQPEVIYNISNGSISAAKTKDNSDYVADNILVKSRIHTFGIPLLYGYKFVDVSPYGMALFVGPKVSYTWEKYTKNEYSGFYQQGISETIHPIRYSAILGLAVNVANVFFDFRYEIGLSNMVKSISYDKAQTEAMYNEQDIILKRRNNELSFSVGVIF